jgi:hypothetical protein
MLKFNISNNTFVCSMLGPQSESETGRTSYKIITGFSQHNSYKNWRYLYSFLLYEMIQPFFGHQHVNIFAPTLTYFILLANVSGK